MLEIYPVLIPKEDYTKYGRGLNKILGNCAESRVEFILQHFQKNGLVKDYLRTKKNHELDQKKIDFVVLTASLQLYLIQVKSRPVSKERSYYKELVKSNIQLIIGNKPDEVLYNSLYNLLA